MMAAAIAVVFASEGYQIYDVRSPDQLHTVLDKAIPQLFLADDAIGSVEFDPGRADAWARDLPGILHLLDKNHLLIWTARHYILEKALAESGIGESIDDFPGEHEILVEVGELTELEKSEMLYNHAKQASLPGHLRQAVRQSARALIMHPSFTPERIRQLIEHLRFNTEKRGVALKSEIEQFLSNPGSRWAKIYRTLSESEKALLISLLDLNESPTTQDLQSAYEKRTIHFVSPPLSFSDAVTRLKHTFVTVTYTYHGIEKIDFKHPSLRDLLLSQLRDDPVARMKYIELTSTVGLAKLVQGLASKGNG